MERCDQHAGHEQILKTHEEAIHGLKGTVYGEEGLQMRVKGLSTEFKLYAAILSIIGSGAIAFIFWMLQRMSSGLMEQMVDISKKIK